MTPPTPNKDAIRAFATADDLAQWLAKHHDRATELYLRIYKKASKVSTVTYAQAVEVALCWGWIDGIGLPHDDASYLQRFTPRRPKSVWSKINRARVERLVAEGRMTPHGLAHVEAAKADGRWAAAYDSPRTMEIPEDLKAAIDAEPRALKTFATLDRANLYALAYRVRVPKTPAGRAKKIAAFVAMLKEGKTIHPLSPRTRTPAPAGGTKGGSKGVVRAAAKPRLRAKASSGRTPPVAEKEASGKGSPGTKRKR